ncbi:MAG: tRNA pseudouridine(54/55) synthase Pus10 [archaeon]|nr:tRNA pseudouridine(54/55) synthase Pus10 [archaeon]
MRADEGILPVKTAVVVIKKTRLCSRCLRRQGVPAKQAAKASVKSRDCEICGGLLADLSEIGDDVSKKLKQYQFETFLVGASIPQEILDKEDEIRARLKIRGREGIKTEITRTIANQVSKSTHRKLNYSRPEITVLASLPERNISVSPRSIWLFARYRKKVRGLSQRSSLCKICNGVGCATCEYRGSVQSSVQSVINDFLTRKYRAENCNFIWVGSEDEKSLVNGNGRPFFVEVQKPKKRKVNPGLSRTIDLDSVTLSSIQVLSSKPVSIPQFTMKCIAYLALKDHNEGESVPEIMKDEIESKFKGIPVRVRLSRKFKVVNKRVYSILVEKDKYAHPFVLEIECDGGIPIRKLVSGEEDAVLPNLSQYIRGFILDPTMPFDIENVFLADPNRLRLKQFHANGESFSSRQLPEETTALNEELEIIAEGAI